MSDFRPLGKPVRAPEPAPKPDEWERKVSHGTSVWKNKTTGRIQTDPPPKPPPPPVKQPLEHMVETIQKSRQQQEDDGFSVGEFGGF